MLPTYKNFAPKNLLIKTLANPHVEVGSAREKEMSIDVYREDYP